MGSFLNLSPVWGTVTPDSGNAQEAPGEKRSVRATCMRLVLVGTLALLPGAFAAEKLTTDGDTLQTATFAEAAAQERLNVFVMGDSMASGDMAYGSAAQTLARTRSRRQVGWVIDVTPEDNGLESLHERLASTYPVRTVNAAWPGAYADGGALFVDRTWPNRLGNIQNFSAQVNRFLKDKTKPNLVIISMFHNNLDFQYDLEQNPKLEKETHLATIPEAVANEYRKHLKAMLASRAATDGKLTIIVLGAIDLSSALKARDQAREMFAEDPSIFPHFKAADTNFPSTQPQHQKDFIQVSVDTNTELERVVDELNRLLAEQGKSSQFQVLYSDAMERIDFSDTKYLHPDDGLHTSKEAKQRIAEEVERDLAPAIEFLLGE